MALLKSSSEAILGRWKVRTEDGTAAWITPFINGKRNDVEIGTLFPVAFLVEQDPNTELTAHFHDANQFQIFVGGSGRLGKKPIDGISIHYANAYTPYGPVIAGVRGINYFTLRNGVDRGAHLMPKSREWLQKNRRKGQHVEAMCQVATCDETYLCNLKDIEEETVLDKSDGLAIWSYRIPPQKVFSGPPAYTGKGQWWVLLSGESRVGDLVLPQHSCIFVYPDEGAPELCAGAKGAEIVIVQFARFT
jgi:hypothetical protein